MWVETDISRLMPDPMMEAGTGTFLILLFYGACLCGYTEPPSATLKKSSLGREDTSIRQAEQTGAEALSLPHPASEQIPELYCTPRVAEKLVFRCYRGQDNLWVRGPQALAFCTLGLKGKFVPIICF